MLEFINGFLMALTTYIGAVTLAVGLIAVYLYLKQKKTNKREAALLILQEIRYAEQRVRNFRSYKSYAFNEKLLPTNSWHKNIHLFVKDLSETELDLISNFFSSAVYLDDVIKFASSHYNDAIIAPITPVVEEKDTKVATADLSPSTQKLIEDISGTLEYIYNSPAVGKFRIISEKKWYNLY